MNDKDENCFVRRQTAFHVPCSTSSKQMLINQNWISEESNWRTLEEKREERNQEDQEDGNDVANDPVEKRC